jgi:hypothetical protein
VRHGSAPKGAPRIATAIASISRESTLLVEAARFLEGGERVLSDALVFGTGADLVESAEHMLTMAARARGFIERVAA